MISQPEILVCGDPRLRQRASEVDDPVSCAELVRRMLDLMSSHNGLGLAATQIGDDRRVVVWRSGEQTKAIVNPVLELGEQIEIGLEGCLSVPGMAGDVKRAVTVQVEGSAPDGNAMIFEARGLEARVLQHEVDHLDGVLFVDRVEPGSLRPSSVTETPGI